MLLGHWMPHVVTWATQTSVDTYGDPSFTAQSTAPARVESRSKLIQALGGNEIESDTVVYTETPIPVNARVWLPGDNTANDSEARRVINVKGVTNRNATQTLYELAL